jgi:hypothetical protein
MKVTIDPEASGAIASYTPFEKAFRDFTCSLMERQDRVEEELLRRIADCQQQIDVLERKAEQVRKAPANTPEGKA